MAQDDAGVQDSFRYRVELDTQGLSAQLASVRNIVTQGLTQATSGIIGGVGLAAGATNQLASDIISGQQLLAASVPAQMPVSLPMGGIAMTTLAMTPGMPQTFMQEFGAAMGVTRPPVGIFPSQFEAIARARLGERVQNAAVGATTSVLSMGAGIAGSIVGNMLLPGIGGFIGGFAGQMMADKALAPFLGTMQDRMEDRARIQQLFGFNKFTDDQRGDLVNVMRQQFHKSIFSQEEFNNVLPAALKGGFFMGVRRGDVQGFERAFRGAEAGIQEAMFTMQLGGAEGVRMAGEIFGGLRRMGVVQPTAALGAMREARVLAQNMGELGEFVNPADLMQQTMGVGQMALQSGLGGAAAMNVFNRQAMAMGRLVETGTLNQEDIALLGGTTAAAAERLTGTLMMTGRHPLMRAAGLAFGNVEAMGRVGINPAALEAAGGGRMTFGALGERLGRLGMGPGGTTQLMTMMANQNKLQSDLMKDQGKLLNSLSEDILKQANMDVSEGTKMFVMQRVFGVGEAESRALVHGLPMEKADEVRLAKDAQTFDKEVKGAIQTAQTGFARDVEVFTRGIKEAIGKPLDEISHWISKRLVPPMESTVEQLKSLNERVGGVPLRSNSPISAGNIHFGSGHDQWMSVPDPRNSQGFRAVADSRVYPKPMISMQTKPVSMGMMPDLRMQRMLEAG